MSGCTAAFRNTPSSAGLHFQTSARCQPRLVRRQPSAGRSQASWNSQPVTLESGNAGRDQLEALQLVAAKKLTSISTLIVTRQRCSELRSPSKSVSLSPDTGNGSEVISDAAEIGCDDMEQLLLASHDGGTAKGDRFLSASIQLLLFTCFATASANRKLVAERSWAGRVLVWTTRETGGKICRRICRQPESEGLHGGEKPASQSDPSTLSRIR